jgi:hypothetical protein
MIDELSEMRGILIDAEVDTSERLHHNHNYWSPEVSTVLRVRRSVFCPDRGG